MTTLIALYTGDGCIGRCDAKCYNAWGPECHCICQGGNHGAGKQETTASTRELPASWYEQAEAAGQIISVPGPPAMPPRPLRTAAMTNPARHLRSVGTAWQADDPVLAALRAARDRRDQADRDIRILLAYARELATPRPYRLADLAEAAGKSISGVRVAYTPHDIDIARHIIQALTGPPTSATHPGDSDHDLIPPALPNACPASRSR